MKHFWASGALSAREVHERLRPTTEWAYSTTRTTLDRMVKKRLLTKNDFHGINLYEARITKPVGIAQLVRDFADRVLEVEPATVVSLFAKSESLTEEEMKELSAAYWQEIRFPSWTGPCRSGRRTTRFTR